MFPEGDDFDEAEADRWVRANAQTFRGVIDETTPERPNFEDANADGDVTEVDDDTVDDEEDPAQRRPWHCPPTPPPVGPAPADAGAAAAPAATGAGARRRPQCPFAPAPAPAPVPDSGLRRQPKRRIFTDDPPAPIKPAHRGRAARARTRAPSGSAGRSSGRSNSSARAKRRRSARRVSWPSSFKRARVLSDDEARMYELGDW